MQRSVLEELGWQQGSILTDESLLYLRDTIETPYALEDAILVVASQSCDVASSQEPVVELSIARQIPEIEKRYSHNRHPRILHTELHTPDSEEKVAVCFLAHEKIQLEKALLEEQKPCKRCFSEQMLNEYISWLAARYKRTALPTTFDALIAQADKRDKRKKVAKNANDFLLGIYVNIYPNREIEPANNEHYSVDLLGIVGSNDDKEKAKLALDKYAEILSKAGMNLSEPKVVTESEISVATFRQYQRINFDSLSFEANLAYPTEV